MNYFFHPIIFRTSLNDSSSLLLICKDLLLLFLHWNIWRIDFTFPEFQLFAYTRMIFKHVWEGIELKKQQDQDRFLSKMFDDSLGTAIEFCFLYMIQMRLTFNPALTWKKLLQSASCLPSSFFRLLHAERKVLPGSLLSR